MKYAVITGVSTGIGKVCTKHLIENGFYVFGSVRKERDVTICQSEFGNNFTPLVFDVRDIQAINKAVLIVQEKIGTKNLSALVNNAGIAVSGPLQFGDPQEIQDLFDINVIGLINTTRAFLPLLGAKLDNSNPSGRIVNISSAAGTFTMPMQIAYAASKHAVESINEGLRRELSLYGIKVISIRPGPIHSQIWSKELAKDVKFKGTIYDNIWNHKNQVITEKQQNAEPTIKVASVVLTAIETNRPKLHYLVYRKKFEYYFTRLLPSRWIDKLLDKQIKKMAGSQ